jgi:DNA-binding response OmpR family regulator
MTARVQLDRISTRAFLKAIRGSRYDNNQFSVLFALTVRPDRITSNDDLVDLVYGDRADGGPVDAVVNIRIAVLRLRARGIKIKTHCTRGYQLAA